MERPCFNQGNWYGNILWQKTATEWRQEILEEKKMQAAIF